MNSFIGDNIPPLSAEEIAELEALEKMSYDDIDLSDIPETTPEEWERAKLRRLRNKNLKIAG